MVNVMSKFVALNLQIKNTDADFPNKITLHKILHDILASLEFCPNSIALLFLQSYSTELVEISCSFTRRQSVDVFVEFVRPRAILKTSGTVLQDADLPPEK